MVDLLTVFLITLMTHSTALILVMLGQGNPELYGGELEIQGGDYFLL